MNENGRWEFDRDGNPRYIPPEGTPRPTSHRTTASRKKSGDSDWHWIAIVGGFIVWWPIGVALLIAEVSGKWKDTDRVTRTVKTVAEEFSSNYTSGMKDIEAREAAKKAAKIAEKQRKKREKDPGLGHGLGHAGLFRRMGVALMAVFGVSGVITAVEGLSRLFTLGFWEEFLPLTVFFLLGAALFLVGASRGSKLKKFKKYLSMIGEKKSVYIPALASVLGKKPRQVTLELEEMLDREFFSQGYIDTSRQTLVLEEANFDAPAPPVTEDATDETLRRIRAINDAIAHPEISAKIQRIEEITGKILRLLEEKPEKAGELRSFLSYYLPQTLKILENYATLEAQGVQGDNITEAKEKIEGMMDKVVEGYETQLDRLFANDVLDISADLKVMESMLEKDGLAVEHKLKF